MDDNNLTTKDAITVLRNLQDWLYFSSMNGGTHLQREAIDMAIRALKSQPPEGPQRKKGKWIHISEEIWKCDQCGEISCCSPNFCPDCGSDMRQREE